MFQVLRFLILSLIHIFTPGDPRSSALIAGKLAYEMAGLSPKDIGAAQIYDCYTYTVEATLADYGFYDRKKSRDFLTVENIGPGGDFPVNTGGGLLAEGYYMGLTPLAEGVMPVSYTHLSPGSSRYSR